MMHPAPPIESTQWVDEVAHWPKELRTDARDRAKLYERLGEGSSGRERGYWAYLALRGSWNEDAGYRRLTEARAKAELEASAREPERPYAFEGFAEQAAEVLERLRRGPAKGTA